MQRAHVVYAHPEPKSFVAAMRDTVLSALDANGWQTSLTDLHAKVFSAVASASDFGSRARPDYLVYSLEQRHAWEHGTIDPEIAAEVHAVQNADLLVLVFPVFWFSVPAQLKGWIDRVFLSGLFYGGRRLYDRGGMRGKHALVVCSLGGREHMFGPDAIHGDLNEMLKHLLKGTLAYVGYSVYEPFFAHHVPYVDEGTRIRMLSDIVDQIQSLRSRRVLHAPTLDDFDDALRPRVKAVRA